MTILGNNTEVIDFIKTLLDQETLDEISAIHIDMSRVRIKLKTLPFKCLSTVVTSVLLESE